MEISNIQTNRNRITTTSNQNNVNTSSLSSSSLKKENKNISDQLVIKTTKTATNSQSNFTQQMLKLVPKLNDCKDLTEEQCTEFAIQLSELKSNIDNQIEFLSSKLESADDTTERTLLEGQLEVLTIVRDELQDEKTPQDTKIYNSYIKNFKAGKPLLNLEEVPKPTIDSNTIKKRQDTLNQIEINKTTKTTLKQMQDKVDPLKNLLKYRGLIYALNPESIAKDISKEVQDLNNPIQSKLDRYRSNETLKPIIESEKNKVSKNTKDINKEDLSFTNIKNKIIELRNKDTELKNQIKLEDATLLYNIKSLETKIEGLKERYLASNDPQKTEELSKNIKALDKEVRLKKELLNNLERINQGNMYYQMETVSTNKDTYNSTALSPKQINIYTHEYDKLVAIINEKNLDIDISRYKNPTQSDNLMKEDLKLLRHTLNYINTYYSREHTEYSFIKQEDDSKPAKLVTPSHPDGINVGNPAKPLSQKTLNNLLKLKEDSGTVDLSIKQKDLGDCYLLTAMDQILHKEDDLIDFLSCFSEEVVEACDEEGNITDLKRLVFTAKKGEPPFKMNFTINEDGSIQLKGYFNDQEKADAGSPIVNIVEEIYTQVRFNDMKANLDNDDPFKKLNFSIENLNTIAFLTTVINILSNQNNYEPAYIDEIIEYYTTNQSQFVPEELKNSKEVLFIEKSINNVSIKKQSDNFTDFSNKIPANFSRQQLSNEWIQHLSSQIKDPTIQRLLSNEQNPTRKREIVTQYSQLANIQEKINYVINNKDLRTDKSGVNDDKKQIWFRARAQLSSLLEEANVLQEIKNSDSYKALYNSINALEEEHFELVDSNLLSQSFFEQNSIVKNETMQRIVSNIAENPNKNIYDNVLSGGWGHEVLNTFLSSSQERIHLNSTPSQDIFNTQYENIQMFPKKDFHMSKFGLRETIMLDPYNTQPEYTFYEKEYDKANFSLYQNGANRENLGLIASHAINSDGILNGIDFNINPWDNDMALLRTVDKYNELTQGMDVYINRRNKV